MLIIKLDCTVNNDLTVLTAQLVCLIDCIHSFKQVLFHLSHSDFYTVQGENSLIDQILLLRVKYLSKSVSLIISLV